MKNSTNLGQNSLNSNANFWAKLKALFALPKWAKVFLGVLSVVAVAGLLGAFALQSWAKDKIQHGEFVLNGVDKGWQERLESGFAYDSRLYFEKADFLLRSKVIAYIDIRDISWVLPIDKNAVSELKSGNRHIKFSTSQNLSEFNGQKLGVVEYKMDFSPLVKTTIKYYIYIMLCLIGACVLWNFYRIYPLESEILRVRSVSFSLGVSLLVFIVTLFIFSTLGFLVKITINSSYFYLALIISLFILLYKNPYKVISLIFYAILFGISIFLALYFYDSSGDGRTYHQTSIFFLANDWNPFYQNIADLTQLAPFFSDNLWCYDKMCVNTEFWTQHYLKFAEITQACVYKVVGYIESGKAINYLFAFGAFFYAISVLSKIKNISLKMLVLISLLAVFSPITFIQIGTYCVDELMACALVFVFLSVLDLEFSRKNGETLKTKYAIFILTLLATASIKLTGIGYAGFIGIVYFLYKLIFFGWQKSKGIFISGAISALLIIICNTNPLITNQLQHGHFGYPLMGKDKIDISQKTKDMKDINSALALVKSIFSKTKNQCCETYETELKIPFLKYSDENSFHTYFMWIGGFGYYFSGVLVLCLVMVALYPQHFKRKEIIFGVGAILGSALINPEAWFARYAPQVWLVPFVFLIYSYTFIQTKLLKILQVVMILCLGLNSYYAFKGAVLDGGGALGRNYTHTIKDKLDNLDYKETIYLYFEPKAEPLFALKLLERGYAIQIISKDELQTLQAQGVEFYPLTSVLDTNDKIVLWNVKPKEQAQ